MMYFSGGTWRNTAEHGGTRDDAGRGGTRDDARRSETRRDAAAFTRTNAVSELAELAFYKLSS